jgi:hypothetical protein
MMPVTLRSVSVLLSLLTAVGVGAVGASTYVLARTQRTEQTLLVTLERQSKQIERLGENERLGEKVEKADGAFRSCPTSGAPAVADAHVLSAEQLDRISAAVTAKVAQANVPPPPPLPTPENIAAMDSGRAVVASAIRAGRWTDSDAKAFREVRDQLTAEDREELQRALAVAINNQQLQFDRRTPML